MVDIYSKLNSKTSKLLFVIFTAKWSNYCTVYCTLELYRHMQELFPASFSGAFG